jgi:hypothetical protein
MNKIPYFLTILALAAIFAVPSATQAQEASVSIRTTVNASSTGPGVLQKMRAEAQVKGPNGKPNVDSRNSMRTRVISTTTASSSINRKIIRKEGQQDIKDLRSEMQQGRKLASTTTARREFRQDMELKMFEIRKDILVRQLNLALNNLKQIRGRILSRIEKAEQSGRNMTEARAALKIADAKLGNAQTQINILVNLNASTTIATSSTATSTATTTAGTNIKIKLDKPRQLGEAAIKAVKDARDALNLVIRAIAKNMGLGDRPATTTPSVSATPSTSASVSPSPSASATVSPSPSVTASPSPSVTP